MTARAAVAAEAAEEKPETIQFDYDSYTYTVNLEDVDDAGVLEDFEDGKIVIPLRNILGEDQWKVFKSKKRRSKALSDLAEAMFDKVGTSLGE